MAKPKRQDVTVKIDAKLQRKAKLVASHRDLTLSEYLSELLEKPVERDYQRFRQELAAEDENAKGD